MKFVALLLALMAVVTAAETPVEETDLYYRRGYGRYTYQPLPHAKYIKRYCNNKRIPVLRPKCWYKGYGVQFCDRTYKRCYYKRVYFCKAWCYAK